MAQSTPTIRDGSLCFSPRRLADTPLPVGSPAWYAWLREHSLFAFANAQGRITARKERAQRGDTYWRAYRTARGTTYRCYLGKSEALTLQRLEAAAATLARRIAGDTARADPPSNEPAHPSQRPASAAEPHATPATMPATLAASQAPRASWTSPHILDTTICMPPPPFGLIERPRLMHLLQQPEPDTRLTVICAPAGEGKTTALVSWLSQHPHPVAWLSPETDEQDPMRFLRLVLAAIERVCPACSRAASALLQQHAQTEAAPIFTEVLNSVVAQGTPLTLVIDDYQLLTAPAIHEAVQFLAEHLPPQLHLIIASRTRPPLAFARLHLHGHLQEVTSRDLRFTTAECATFFAPFTLPAEVVAHIAERTEGWAAGLRYVALALKREQPTRRLSQVLRGIPHEASALISAYVVEEVLRQQSGEVRRFLLETALLHRLCGSLCDAVTGLSNSRRVLNILRQQQLFITALGGDGDWLRYHHLFGESLRQLAERELSSEDLRERHLRAAAWYANHNMLDEAIGHALDAQDYATVVGWLIQRIPQWKERGEYLTLCARVGALPEAVLLHHPELCVAYIQGLLTTGRSDEAEHRLRQLDAAVGTLEAPEFASQPELAWRLWEVHADAAVMRGAYAEAITGYRHALASLPEDQVATQALLLGSMGAALLFTEGAAASLRVYQQAVALSQAVEDWEGTLEHLYGLGAVQAILGRLQDAAACYCLAIDRSRERSGEPAPLMSATYLYLAKIHYEWDHLARAQELLEMSGLLNQQLGDPVLHVRCLQAQALVHLARRDPPAACALLHEVEQFADTAGLRAGVRALAAAGAARLALSLDDLDRALRWAHTVRREDGDREAISELRRTELSTLARLHLLRGEPERALAIVEPIAAAALAKQRVDRQIQFGLLQALALQALGRTDEALAHLTQVLAWAEPGQYVRTFLDEGAPIGNLCRQLAQRLRRGGDLPGSAHTACAVVPVSPLSPLSLRSLRRLLSALPAPAAETATLPVQGTVDRAAEPLSAREREILHLLAQGRSNAEIARSLVVEVSTVKWHLTNIYGKLGVRNRVQVLATLDGGARVAPQQNTPAEG